MRVVEGADPYEYTRDFGGDNAGFREFVQERGEFFYFPIRKFFGVQNLFFKKGFAKKQKKHLFRCFFC